MRDRHDKRLRFYIVVVRLSLTIFAVVLTFSPFSVNMAVFFVFLRNIRSTIEILKIEVFRIFLPSFAALFRR